MSTHLSSYFCQQREAKGLRPGQLARLAGCANVEKQGGRIREFEISGKISKELFERLTTALNIDLETIERLVGQDRKEFFEAWLKWVNEPIQPHLVVRLMAAVYSSQKLPPEITTMEEAEAYASSVAAESKRRVCLVWSRRISCWFLPTGELNVRTDAEPGQPNLPWLKVRGKGTAFVFGEGLTTGSTVDWPVQKGPGATS